VAKELFRAVQTAEEKADRLVQEAQHQARELLKTTEADIAQSERGMELEQRGVYQSVLDEKRKSVAEQIQAKAADVEKQQNAVLEAARAHMAEAAKQIAERVWNDGHR